MQTVYITSGYRWEQNTKTITLYLRILGANEIDGNSYTLDVQSRSIFVGINNHRGVNYNFKLGKLCGQLEPQGTKIEFQEKQVVITLQKKEYGKHWNDIKEKSIHEVYNQMQRKLRYSDSQVGEKNGSMSKDFVNGYGEQQNFQEPSRKAFGYSDPSTCQAAANLPSDLGYTLDPFHISDIIPSTSSQCPCPHSHSDEKKC